MRNQLKTLVLLVLLTLALLYIGQLVGGVEGLTIALIFSILMNFGAYFWSHKFVLAMYRAKEANPSQYKELHSMVGEVAGLAKIPKPKVYIIPTEAPNAFATGRNPKNGIVACTEGILKLLSKDELKGVIAHEISHIKNRDILVQTVAATIAGVISYVAMMARWGAIFGGFGRDRDGANIIELLVLAIVMPIVAVIIQLAISRSREYLADESAAKIVRNGFGLAAALEKLDKGSRHTRMRMGNQATASMFIVNPLHRGAFVNLLSTHPPMKERIKRLRNMVY